MSQIPRIKAPLRSGRGPISSCCKAQTIRATVLLCSVLTSSAECEPTRWPRLPPMAAVAGHFPGYHALWDVIEELPSDARLPLKKWVQTVHAARTTGTNDARGCRCCKQTHLDAWGRHDVFCVTTVDELISAVGHGAPREVIDVLCGTEQRWLMMRSS